DGTPVEARGRWGCGRYPQPHRPFALSEMLLSLMREAELSVAPQHGQDISLLPPLLGAAHGDTRVRVEAVQGIGQRLDERGGIRGEDEVDLARLPSDFGGRLIGEMPVDDLVQVRAASIAIAGAAGERQVVAGNPLAEAKWAGAERCAAIGMPG